MENTKVGFLKCFLRALADAKGSLRGFVLSLTVNASILFAHTSRVLVAKLSSRYSLNLCVRILQI